MQDVLFTCQRHVFRVTPRHVFRVTPCHVFRVTPCHMFSKSRSRLVSHFCLSTPCSPAPSLHVSNKVVWSCRPLWPLTTTRRSRWSGGAAADVQRGLIQAVHPRWFSEETHPCGVEALWTCDIRLYMSRGNSTLSDMRLDMSTSSSTLSNR